MRRRKPREDRISQGSEGGSEMLKEAPGQCLKTQAGLANQRSLVNSRILSAEMTGKNGCRDTGEWTGDIKERGHQIPLKQLCSEELVIAPVLGY